ncbi:hypothetical protein [Candidatus Palauibacter sp.]|uniref:hypothetical protein n=1 Tax=Candidatus Palauibacter sp. TaxID=3101350 RepID=UPI003B0176F0
MIFARSVPGPRGGLAPHLAPVLALVVVLGGCGDGRSLPPGASAEARAAFEECRSLQHDEKQACYERHLLDELDRAGVGPALEMLETVAVRDLSVEAQGHVYTHAIGIEAYSPETPFEEVFSECTVLFQSGCYHGVVQSHFIASGAADAEQVVEVCAPFEREPVDRWILFQCLHGLGHGLTMFYGHHLPMALEGCDSLTNDWNRESCYGGVFMENVVNATDPHHPASELLPGEGEGGDGAEEGHGTRGAHDHAAMAMTEAVEPLEPWEALRAEDPHYPCSVLDERYLRACYMMQTSAMLWHNEGDIGGAATSCLDAPEGWRFLCFVSLGRDISGRTVLDPDNGLDECGKSPEEFREWCYVGLVKNYVDVTAATGAGFAFCRRVEPWAQARCYEAMGEQLLGLYADDAGRREECVAARPESEELEQACLRGARVPIH